MSFKPWTPDEMAKRVAERLQDGAYVNLGIGMPQLVTNHLPPGREVIYHCENGLIGTGPRPVPGEEDPDAVDAGGERVTLVPGAAIVSHDMSFAIIRGGHLDVTVLGAYQVSEQGDLANWMIGGEELGNIGGAMDLAVGTPNVYALMRHTEKGGGLKVVRECSYPLTAAKCVTAIFTDLAVIDVTPSGLVVQEMAPGLTLEELQKVTEPRLRLSPTIG